jgi:hypothetical protein
MTITRKLVLPLAVLGASAASAHHPGSHAARQPDGRIRLEIAVPTSDLCTGIGDVALGPPPGIAPAPGAAPVTVHLKRPDGPCVGAASVARGEQMLDLPRQESQVLVYVIGEDGTIVSTERVPLR